MTFKVKPCKDLDEFSQAVFAIGQYFALDPTEERMERFSKNLPIERMHAARENGRIVGGAGAFPFELTVPGGDRADRGRDRRRHLSDTPPPRRTAGDDARAARRRARARRAARAAVGLGGDDLRPLRVRHGLARRARSAFRASTRRSPMPHQHERALRFVDAKEALELFPKVWDKVRKKTPGMLGRSRNWWEFRILFEPPGGGGEGGPKRFVVLERDGRPEGYAIYRHKPKWDDGVSNSELEVVEAIALDGRPTAELWRFLLDVDWAARITAWLLPIDHPLFHLLATPRRMRFRVGDGLWARLVDVGKALSARSYAADGVVVFDVIDSFCPWNEGGWRLAGGRARRTTAAPQLRCDVTALGSVYLGGFSFSELVRGGRVEELRRGAAARADAHVRVGAGAVVPGDLLVTAEAENLVPAPARGRTFASRRRVRLSDMDARGRLRLDAVARFLQDTAIEDVEETGWGLPDHLWFIRSIRIDVVRPFVEDRNVELVTWCSGLATIAAGRRWSLAGDGGGRVEVDSVWIHLGPDERPARLDDFGVYAEATGGRRVSTRPELPPPAAGAERMPWPLRVTDVDLHGHLNNAAYWQAVEERLARRRNPDPASPLRARLDYRQPIDVDDPLELAESSDGDILTLGFAVEHDVRAVARVEPLAV